MAVKDTPKKPVIGILGGVGSGKSTVAAEFAKLGCKVVDADRIAHQLLEEEAVKEKVVACFGKSILDSSGQIARAKLAKIVFADANKVSALNKIIHPLVVERVEKLVVRYSREKQVKAIVLDIPLLVEIGWDKRCDRLVFVDCREELRLRRAKNDKFLVKTEEEIKIRENFQISLDSKANITDNIIDNNSGLAELARQVTDIFSSIVDDG